MPVTLRPYRDTDADPTWRVFHTAVRVTAAADYTPEQLEAWSPDEAVLGEARRRGLTRVVTHASRTARPAFERLGFVVDRENPDNTTRGVRVPNFDMHLDLPAEPG